MIQNNTQAGDPRTVAYLKVSTIDQDLEKNKRDILYFTNEKDFGKVFFIEEKVTSRKPWRERKLKAIIDVLCEGDRLILLEPSCLDRLKELVPRDGLNILIKGKFYPLRQFVNSSPHTFFGLDV